MRESLEFRGDPKNLEDPNTREGPRCPGGDLGGPRCPGGAEGAGIPQCPVPPPRDRGSLSQFGTGLTGVPRAQVREPPAGGEGPTGDTGRDWRELGRAERGTGGHWEGAGGVCGGLGMLGRTGGTGQEWRGLGGNGEGAVVKLGSAGGYWGALGVPHPPWPHFTPGPGLHWGCWGAPGGALRAHWGALGGSLIPSPLLCQDLG